MQAHFTSDKPLPDTSLSWRYGLNYAAIFFVMGIFAPFFPLFLSGQGFDASAIGFLIALGGPARIIASPLMGWVADAGMPLRILSGVVQACAVVIVLLMLGVTQLPLMAVLVAATAALHAPVVSMIDASLTHHMAERPALNYARIRLWGSVSFVAGNFAGGLTAQYFPYHHLALLIAAGLALGALISILLPSSPSARSGHARIAAPPLAGRWGLIAAVIAAFALVQASHAAIYTISALAWGAQGLSQTTTGLLWMLGIITEIILFLRIGNAVSGAQRALLFIAIGGGTALVRWLIMASEPGLALTMLCQFAHGITFGATHLGIIAALAALSPPAFRSRIQGVCAAMQALVTSAAIYGSGLLYQSGGATAAYGLMAVLAGAGLVFVLLLYLRERITPSES